MRTPVVAAAVVSATIGCGAATAADPDFSSLNPDVMKYVLPDKINWQVTPGLDTAFLYGNPNQPGFYVLMFKWKPGNSSHPHYHSTDRHVVVMSGTWWVAYRHRLGSGEEHGARETRDLRHSFRTAGSL